MTVGRIGRCLSARSGKPIARISRGSDKLRPRAELGMGLEDRMQTRIGLLSGGQRQAVTLVMATLVTPKLLLLDEHTAALDPVSAEKVMELTVDIVRREKLTAMMITHNMQSALQTGTRTLMLDSGAVALDLRDPQRREMTVQNVLDLFAKTQGKIFDNDRTLL
jgi:putative ABC transport system ATP-binding protein